MVCPRYLSPPLLFLFFTFLLSEGSSSSSVVSTLFRSCDCPTRDCFCMRAKSCDSIGFRPSVCQQSLEHPTVGECAYYEDCCSVPQTLWSPEKCEETCAADDVSDLFGGCGTWPRAGSSRMPWTASLIQDNRPSPVRLICGATIIHPRLVLTAAGCLRKVAADGKLFVVAGIDKPFVELQELETQKVRVLRSVAMSHFAKGDAGFDLALLELEESLVRDPGVVDVACLRQPDSSLDLCNCWASGLLLNREDPENSSWRRMKVQVLNHESCENLFWDLINETYTPSFAFICAVGDSRMYKTDYGGPVVCPLKGDPMRFVLAGVLGRPIVDADAIIPMPLVNAEYHGPWIQTTLQDLGYENYAVHPRF